MIGFMSKNCVILLLLSLHIFSAAGSNEKLISNLAKVKNFFTKRIGEIDNVQEESPIKTTEQDKQSVSFPMENVSHKKNGIVQRLQSIFTRNYGRLSASQRLATTPVYCICNSRGNAFMQDDVQSGNTDQKVITYFMSSDDANKYVNELSQTNGAKEVRIMATSLEKVFHQIESKKQSKKFGRIPLDTLIRIQPSLQQWENAKDIRSQSKSRKEISTIPMFSVDGLVVRRANGEVVKPYYFALEDLEEDWQKLHSYPPSSSSSMSSSTAKQLKPKEIPAPKVMLNDFTEVYSLASGWASFLPNTKFTQNNNKKQQGTVAGKAGSASVDVLKNAGIVPPRREIDMIRKFYRNQGSIKNEFSKAKYIPPN